ncbi:MAG TPA: endo alpha-1,4 polygalactosaminidase, partial [Opitutaceae bacterium]
LGDARWAEFLVDELATAAAKRGFDGFFLDTLDSVETISPDRRPAAIAGLVATIQRLRRAFPTKRIVVNRGFFVFDAVRDAIDGVVVESLYETFDSATKQYRSVPEAETEALLAALAPIAASGRAVYILDYADPRQPVAAATAAMKIRARGFHAFVSTPDLDGDVLGPLRPTARRICAFYGNLTTIQEDQVRWPAESFTAQKLQLPLEWLGYEVDYFRIDSANDLPQLDSDYRAVVLPRSWEIPVQTEGTLVDWLLAQREAGRKILIFGFPFRDPEQQARFLKAMGISGSGATLSPPLTLQTRTKAPGFFDFEVQVPLVPIGHRNLQAPADARLLMSVEATRPSAAPVRFDAVFTCAWGGMAFEPYVTFRRADFREFWNLDPFAFLQAALGDSENPVPDATTRNGRRMLLTHIDGDGFSNFSRVEAGQRSAEIIRDRILKKYPYPATVSIIEAELRGLIRTQRTDDAPTLEAIARDIFKLPQVEIASHSFSHPFFWIAGDRTEAFYDEQNLDLKIPYDKLDLQREIEGSVLYIDEKLAPPDRKTRVFLWSGNCRPPPEALAIVRKLGLENLNGGDTIISARNRTVMAVAPRTMPWGDELQIYAPNQNENVYTNNWRGPLFGTFGHVIETFQLTEAPRRLKPMNIYYHFYSGDYPSSLQALEKIYEWVGTQSPHPIEVSHYARLARDTRGTEIFSAGHERWLIVNRGESRTVRMPALQGARIDLARSRGILGWKIDQGQAYVHTDGSPIAVLALAAEPRDHLRLESASGDLRFAAHGPASARFTVESRPLQAVFAGLPAGGSVRITTAGSTRTEKSDTTGRLILDLAPGVDVDIQLAAP